LLRCVTLANVNNRAKIVLSALGITTVIALPTLAWRAEAQPAPVNQAAAVSVVAPDSEGASAVPTTSANTTPAASVAASAVASTGAATAIKPASKPGAQRAAAPADDPTGAPTDSPTADPATSAPLPNLYIPSGSLDGHSWPTLYCHTPEGPPCYDSDGNEYVFLDLNGVPLQYTEHAGGYWALAQ
jgi:hypothetical protein